MPFCTYFIYVPVTGRISPGMDQNPVGPLSLHSSSAGGPVRARGGHLQGRGTNLPSGSCASEPRTTGSEPTCPE